MNASYYRQERTRTVVRHVVETPVQWVDLQKLMRIAFRDAGYAEQEPPDDAFWWESEDGELALCCELVSGSSGGITDREPIR